VESPLGVLVALEFRETELFDLAVTIRHGWLLDNWLSGYNAPQPFL
jgi:hypothetical protein